jgi:hypothetical protein
LNTNRQKISDNIKQIHKPMGIEQPVRNFQDLNLIVGANNKHESYCWLRLDIKCENKLHAAVEVEMNTRKPPGSLTSM